MFDTPRVPAALLRRIWTCFYVVLLISIGSESEAQTKRALLIGINTYQPEHTSAQHPQGCTYGRCDLTSFENLSGTLNDVAAMRDLLASPKFGFPIGNIITVTDPALTDSPPGSVNLPSMLTSHDGILTVLQKYLVDWPKRGDTVIFYYSGHGSLRVNSKGTKLTVEVKNTVVHADSTIVPSDAWTGVYDVRDRELTRIFNAALDKGIRLTVIFDSCYSGGITRGITLGRSERERWVPFDPRDINEGPDHLPNGQLVPVPAERSDNPGLIFSAVQQDQTAKESPPPDDLPPHGVFTVALIRALQVLPVNSAASVVYQYVKDDLEGNGIGDETPFLDANSVRREQPLFGGAQETASKFQVGILGSDFLGNVVLDTGKLAGIGIGSTFTSVALNSSGQKVTLKVTTIEGITRSKAQIITPKGAIVTPGDVYELAEWIPSETQVLHVWTWPANLSQATLAAAVSHVIASGIAYSTDPVGAPWTDMLFWNGSKWAIQHVGHNVPSSVLPELTPVTLKNRVPSGARLWVNLPPSRELASRLELHNPNSAIQSVADVSDAEYVLAGTIAAGGPSWAWVSKAELHKQVTPITSSNHTAGCSDSSPYPARTAWVTVTSSTVIAAVAQNLNDYASRLAKLHGWINLASSPTDGSAQSYYSLQLVRMGDHKNLINGDQVQQGDLLDAMLTASDAVTQKRWVYIIDIDCQGSGTLLYPGGLSGNGFPNNAQYGPSIDLTGIHPIVVGSPFGVDTIVFLTTPQPLSDPSILNFEGVAKGLKGIPSPLETLLFNTSDGRRGLTSSSIPTDWGINIQELTSSQNGAPSGSAKPH